MYFKSYVSLYVMHNLALTPNASSGQRPILTRVSGRHGPKKKVVILNYVASLSLWLEQIELQRKWNRGSRPILPSSVPSFVSSGGDMMKGSRIFNPQCLDTPTSLPVVYHFVSCCGLTPGFLPNYCLHYNPSEYPLCTLPSANPGKGASLSW